MQTYNKYLSAVILTACTCATSLVNANEQDQPAPEWTEYWEPEPRVVTPGPVPSDAIVLLGKDTGLSQWQHKEGEAAKWTFDNGVMTVKAGTSGVNSKQKFCDMQLHIEWRTPPKGKEDWQVGQNSGNSGIYIQGRYEVQVLDSYQNRTYSNGQAGAVYKQTPPLVNASKPPMQWQTYDIIYRAPRFDSEGRIDQKAYVTVLHNGVLVQNHTQIQGPTVYRGYPRYTEAHGCESIHLQDHGNPVSYRNIWVRPL